MEGIDGGGLAGRYLEEELAAKECKDRRSAGARVLAHGCWRTARLKEGRGI